MLWNHVTNIMLVFVFMFVQDLLNVTLGENNLLLTLDIQLQYTSFWYWLLVSSQEEAWAASNSTQTALGRDQVILSIREYWLYLSENIILVSVTVVVTILHAIFDFLALKSDIDFWSAEDLQLKASKLSSRVLIFNALAQFIILLSLIDAGTHIVFQVPYRIRWCIFSQLNRLQCTACIFKIFC